MKIAKTRKDGLRKVDKGGKKGKKRYHTDHRRMVVLVVLLGVVSDYRVMWNRVLSDKGEIKENTVLLRRQRVRWVDSGTFGKSGLW